MNERTPSIVAPAFNEEQTVVGVLECIFRFLPEVHEVIVVDDASMDETLMRCHTFAERLERAARTASGQSDFKVG